MLYLYCGSVFPPQDFAEECGWAPKILHKVSLKNA